jgi:hypothetical protein
MTRLFLAVALAPLRSPPSGPTREASWRPSICAAGSATQLTVTFRLLSEEHLPSPQAPQRGREEKLARAPRMVSRGS